MAASALLRAAARNYAILDLTFGEILERARGELLFTRRRAIAGKLVQDPRELRCYENSEVLVGRVLCHVSRE